ncbi:MAG: GNAT family N-acetyltransferase [Myxococcota bacterium]|jgi:GNAT superfamily N-acetyltransferase|nr:GNAT family N-acetyltransferase [Myxococcota bacterium]
MSPVDEHPGEARASVQELPWDSAQFGIGVGTIDLDRAGAHEALANDAARFDLIYARTRSDGALDENACEQWNGALVDRRVTFARTVAGGDIAAPSLPGEIRSLGVTDPLTDRALELAPQAATYSRFRTDPRFPDAWTDALYRVWMQNSLSRERADDVLAYVEGDELHGLYTVRVVGDDANLELFAVDEPMRGRGIGRALLAAGLAWMRDHEIACATVTTQLENPACALYRACGYSEAEREAIYHLWPRDGATAQANEPS